MSKKYSAGDLLPATELNEIVRSSGLYGASSAGSDAYAITVSPKPDNYTAGDVFRFKADVANTGACTLNVNSLGAKAIKKNVSEDLVTGDILAGQLITVEYDGTNFQLVNIKILNYNNGSTTRNLTATDRTVNIAHGLGQVPKRVAVKTVLSASIVGDGVYSNSKFIARYWNAIGSDVASKLLIYTGPNAGQALSISADDTNIIFTWDKEGSPTGTVYILWEANT
ncbi:MAG: hypothetical protein BWY21_01901 [Parcubacteria group bacterium ADurb.Bin216]|nr:MAG: hypothetical protein BWY21_01901 [Parcubacteria group bacterium ADurb.Bin216]